VDSPDPSDVVGMLRLTWPAHIALRAALRPAFGRAGRLTTDPRLRIEPAPPARIRALRSRFRSSPPSETTSDGGYVTPRGRFELCLRRTTRPVSRTIVTRAQRCFTWRGPESKRVELHYLADDLDGQPTVTSSSWPRLRRGTPPRGYQTLRRGVAELQATRPASGPEEDDGYLGLVRRRHERAP